LAARPASDAAVRLEDMGRDADLSQAEAAFDHIEKSVQALESALSDWVNDVR